MDSQMDNNLIRLRLADWQWNAAVIGFINIVGERNVSIVDDTVEFAAGVLDGFEDKYFDYLIRTYEKTLSWQKIVSFKVKLDDYTESDFESFDLKALKDLNNYIKDVKRFTKSNSYKAAYDLIDSDLDLLSLEKQLATIKEPTGQPQFDADKKRIIAEAEQAFTLLRLVIDYCENPESKRYIAAKNIIYNIINNAWNGVSFLNRQTKIKDVYTDYRNYFVDNTLNYLKSDKQRFKYKCFVCDEPMKDLNNDLSFLNSTGFDVARKSSHVWDFQNDIAVCPLCKLIYSCLPAGMIYTFDRGIYVNANIRLQDALNINFKIKKDILDLPEGGMRSIYHSLVGALHEQENNAAKYELADVQIVRYENETYRFNILSRRMLQTIVESEAELNSLIRAAFNENNTIVQIYDEVIARIFNSQNLFSLIHKMLHYKLSDPAKCYFNGMHVNYMLKINQRIYISLGGVKVEKNKEQIQDNLDLVKKARAAGYYLRGEYNSRNSGNKLPGICYRLLNALKTSNSDMFMDVILNCYLYVRCQVPKVITDVLGQEKSFSTMGYAFVAGLIDAQDIQENIKGEGK